MPPAGSRSPRAILFDLDDTLIDTFSSLIVPLEREAAMRMAATTAGSPSAQDLFELLIRLRRERPERLGEELAEVFSGSADVRALLEIRESVLSSVPIERLHLDPEILHLLRELSHECLLFLLTEGDPGLQNGKIDYLGIRDLFAEIIVTGRTESAKEEAIVDLLKRRHLRPDSVVIVGNRLDREIRAGERLRITTVWLRQGEGSHHQPGEQARPDHVIASLRELPALLASLDGSESP